MPTTPGTVERLQAWIYLAAGAAGLMVGTAWPSLAPVFGGLLWFAVAILLFATFVQVPLLHLREAFRNRRFVAASLVGNFVVLPVLVWLLLLALPSDPAIRLGVALVLLVPCTDWFITFAQLGGGDVPGAIAITPANLLLQLLLLPVYLWIILGEGLPIGFGLADVWPAILVVFLNLLAAFLSERWIEARPERSDVRVRLARWPVPLLAVVVFLIAGAQVQAVRESWTLMGPIVTLFVVFLFATAIVAKGLAKTAGLSKAEGRTLAFGLGTRNSFVVLPLALTLPEKWGIAAVVIVAQSLVELFGMIFFLWWVPRCLFR